MVQRRVGGSARGLAVSRDALAHVGLYPPDLHAVDGRLRPSATATREAREARCIALQQAWEARADPVEPQCAKRRSGFALGLFVGDETAECPADNVDWERWCKGPKGHERRIQGQRPAGVRIVQQGPTLMLALDAPGHHDGPFTGGDLAPYGHARVPERQQQAVERGKIMRQARSRKTRSVLLADLEKRYGNAP